MAVRSSLGGGRPRARVHSAQSGVSGTGTSLTALPQTGSILSRWSADDITPQSDNTTFQTWTDSVGSVAATQATGALRPFYRTNVIGTKPSVQFKGTQVLQIGRPSALVTAVDAQLITVFVVFKTVNTVANGCLFHTGSNFIQAQGTTVGRFGGGLGQDIPYTGQTNFSSIGLITNSGYTNGAGTGVEHIAVNGCYITQSSTMNSGTGGTGNLAIGSDYANASFTNFDGHIFDIVVWDRALTPSEMLQAQKWANDKYAQANLWASSTYFPVFDGDSITAGVGATTAAGIAPLKAANSLSLAMGTWINCGIGGDSAVNMNSRAPTWVDGIYAQVGKKVKIMAFEWYNQRSAAPTPQNNSLTYISGRRTSNTKVCWGTSTDNSDVAPDQNRVDYDTYFDSNHSGTTMDGYIALHGSADIGAEGAYLAFPANWSDTVHLSDAGYTFLAALMVTGLNTIP